MNDETVEPKAKKSTPKTKSSVNTSEKHYIDSSTPVEDLIQWDTKGEQVFFTEDIEELPAEVLDKLSRLTVIKYQQALEIKDRLSKVDPEWDKITKGLEISQSAYASPKDIAFGNKAKNGLVTRLVREDMIGTWSSRGYILARPEHMKEAKMRQVEGHYQHGTGPNAPKEYLMVTTEENRQKLLRLREEKRKAIDGAQVENIKKQSRDAGIPMVDAS